MPRIVFNNHDWTSWWSQWGEKDSCFQFLFSFPPAFSFLLHPLFSSFSFFLHPYKEDQYLSPLLHYSRDRVPCSSTFTSFIQSIRIYGWMEEEKDGMNGFAFVWFDSFMKWRGEHFMVMLMVWMKMMVFILQIIAKDWPNYGFLFSLLLNLLLHFISNRFEGKMWVIN